MITQESQQAPYFSFNCQVPETGNVQRDKAKIKIEFEKALDAFFEKRPECIQFHNELLKN